MLVPPTPSAPGRTLAIGGLAASLLAVMVAGAAFATRPHVVAAPADSCAVPFDIATLSPHEKSLAARRMFACSDLEAGRITLPEYRTQIAALDAQWQKAPPATQPGPEIQWASAVRGFSTQYTTATWSAARVLGAPDVSAAGTDNANAWASLGADDRAEWLEVGFQKPMRVSAVDVIESYNPGAVASIELITASGRRISAYQGQPAAVGTPSRNLHVETGCTNEPIVAVSVQIASQAVPGWNEIDAIGIEPCAQQ